MRPLRKLVDFVRRRHENSPEADLLIDETVRSWATESATVDPERESDWRVIQARIPAQPEHGRIRPGRTMHRFLKPALATALIVALAIAGDIWLNRLTDTVYRTERGERATVTLPDSSSVSLNHTSMLTVVSVGGEGTRRVAFSGEAYFRVQKEPRPFEVSTSSGTVRVLGTEFNVMARDGRMEVAVIRGNVAVRGTVAGSDSAVTLSAGEISAWRKGEAPGPPSPIPVQGYPGWINGRLLFYRTTLADACREIEQTFNVTVRIIDPRLGEQTLTGAVEESTIENTLGALTRLTGNRFRYENGSYVLY